MLLNCQLYVEILHAPGHVNVLTNEGHQQKTYFLSNTELVSMTDIANELSVSGPFFILRDFTVTAFFQTKAFKSNDLKALVNVCHGC